ncbi:TraY domain-containing protein [Thiothrix unzii]|uniref:Relaxosome protein TraY n=1 Tax=Thiothrix unzii TaxID=111769 RepID=A0A975F8T9_9GAMM|nr:TraY domain-containing protein [Thiothrix unzii]QTR53123.1 TraY domain-containing protein [Thiothrix unzii]
MNTDNRPPPYSMRLDPDLRAKLEAIAKANGRSLHAEISIRLEASLLTENTTQAGNKFWYFEDVPPGVLEVLKEDMRRVALEVVREELTKAGK